MSSIRSSTQLGESSEFLMEELTEHIKSLRNILLDARQKQGNENNKSLDLDEANNQLGRLGLVVLEVRQELVALQAKAQSQTKASELDGMKMLYERQIQQLNRRLEEQLRQNSAVQENLANLRDKHVAELLEREQRIQMKESELKSQEQNAVFFLQTIQDLQDELTNKERKLTDESALRRSTENNLRERIRALDQQNQQLTMRRDNLVNAEVRRLNNELRQRDDRIRLLQRERDQSRRDHDSTKNQLNELREEVEDASSSVLTEYSAENERMRKRLQDLEAEAARLRQERDRYQGTAEKSEKSLKERDQEISILRDELLARNFQNKLLFD